MLAATTTEVKQFMNRLLSGDTFDRFLLCEATIQTGSSFVIDGHINKDFYDTDDPHRDEKKVYQAWSEIKPIVFQMIKGKRTPLGMKLVLSLSREEIEDFTEKYHLPVTSDHITGLYLNIRYEQEKLTLSTGTALSIFTLDKTIDLMWDELVTHILESNEIPLTPLA